MFRLEHVKKQRERKITKADEGKDKNEGKILKHKNPHL